MSTPQHTAQGAPQASGKGPQRPTYPQAWAAYNAAQTHEKNHVAELLRSLCDAIETPQQHRGRPRIPLADAVFAATMKTYGTLSGRRTMTDMREYATSGLIDRAPHYNSTFRYLENPILTPILKAMIEESARPMRQIETDFAADSTGFTTRVYQRWYDSKYGRMKVESGWVKLHVMVGVRTNIVTAVEVTGPTANDSPQFEPLLRQTTGHFNVEKVSADKAYSSKKNIEAIHMIGAFPLIPFKSNTTGVGPPLWRRMYHFFLYNQDEFMRHYHKRSNVETTFSMIKAKFGGFVRSKTTTAQVNEVLCKVLCHNLCVLVQSMFETGTVATFWGDKAA